MAWSFMERGILYCYDNKGIFGLKRDKPNCETNIKIKATQKS
jgi:hypothetical protein